MGDETLITIHEEGTVFIWNSMTGEEVKYLQCHRGTITDLQFSDDRMMMMTCSRDQTIKLWQLAYFEIVKEFKTDRPLNSVSMSPLCLRRIPKLAGITFLPAAGRKRLMSRPRAGLANSSLCCCMSCQRKIWVPSAVISGQ